MFAVAAAIIFALALILDWANVRTDAFSNATLVTLGLLLISLHLAGFAPWRRTPPAP